MDDLAIARWRLRTLRLAWQTFPSAPAAVEGMLAVQAENHAQASWAVSTRTADIDEGAFGGLFDDGAILRTHVLRPTWHFVRPSDILWLLELTSPRIRRTMRALQSDVGLSDTDLDRSARLIADALSGGTHLTRESLGERLGDAGFPAAGMGFGVITANAELSGLICSGPLEGRDHTYALLAERAPDARRLDRDQALAEITLRYFTGHGPATERDLSYWATLTLTDVRKGLALAGDRLDSFEHDGRTFWHGQPAPGNETPAPRAHILQTLDEYHNGYQDSRHVLDIAGIVPRGRQATVGMVLIDGQQVGGMRRQVRTDSVRFDIGLFRDVDAGELAAIEAAAGRYGAFLGLDAEVVAAPA